MKTAKEEQINGKINETDVRTKDALYGLMIGGALGDAMGSIKERSPELYIEQPNDARKVHLGVGYWQESTALLLCVARSLLDSEGFNGFDLLGKYRRCYNTGWYTSDGVLSNVDDGTIAAIMGQAHDSSGDLCAGPLARVAAVAAYYCRDYSKAMIVTRGVVGMVNDADEVLTAGRFFVSMVHGALNGMNKKQLYMSEYYNNEIADRLFQRRALDECNGADDIYGALEMVLHCFRETNNFTDGLIMAVNHSTCPSKIGALYGQLAGAYYGLSDIKEDWVEILEGADTILSVTDDLWENLRINPVVSVDGPIFAIPPNSGETLHLSKFSHASSDQVKIDHVS